MNTNYYYFIFIVFIISIESNHINAQSTELESRSSMNGSLLLVGGKANTEIWDQLKELMGGEDELLVVVPTGAAGDILDEVFLEEYKTSFTDLGFTNVEVLHTRNRNEANSNEFVGIINSASGVWFSGGRQWRHVDSYLNTKTHYALYEVLKRGGVIAGNSAGATLLGSFLARGDTKSNTIMMGGPSRRIGFNKKRRY